MSDILKRSIGRPKSFNCQEELKEQINEYIRIWESQGRPLTVVGLALYLGVSRETLCVYERGIYDTEFNNYSDIIKKTKMYIEMLKWEALLVGDFDKTGLIFDLKVNHKCRTDDFDDNYINAKIDNSININLDLKDYTDEELRTIAESRKIIEAKRIN